MSEPDRPVYRVAIAGLESRDARLIEIVFRHSRYNQVSFELVQPDERTVVDILVANPYDNLGLRAMARARAAQRPVPVVVVVPDGRQPRGRYTILLEKLPLQLLPTLNRLVRTELLAPTPAPQVLRARPVTAEPESRPAAGSPVVAPAQPSGSDGPRPADARRASTDGATPIAQTPADAASLSALGRRGRATAIVVEPAASARSLDGATATLIFPLTGFGDTLLPATQFPPLLEASPVPPLSVRRPAAPAAAPDSAAPAHAKSTGEPQTGGDDAAPEVARVSVLVVDDSPTVRRQLLRALAQWGIEALAVNDAEQALGMLGSRHFDLALVDVVMPGRNGFALTRDLRRLYPSMPVILLTQRSTPIDLARGALAGCAAYLRKPIKPDRLESEVMNQLRRSLAIDDLSAVLRAPVRAPGHGVAAAPGRLEADVDAGSRVAPTRRRSGGI
ncbi:MAG: response regulator [Burkholderiaceae bacterium]